MVLDLPAMRRGVPQVLAGDANLDRPVRWVHAGEVLNMASLLKGGELLLITGMGLGDDAPVQRRFVAELAERGVAALVVELGTAFETMPEALVAEAGERRFPLIALNNEIPFVEVTESVHRGIVNHQFLLMRRADELHRRFTSLMIRGAGVSEVLSALAETIANPVVLERQGHGVLYHAVHESSTADVLAAWAGVSRGIPGCVNAISVDVPATDDGKWGSLVALSTDSPLDEFDRVAVERAVALVALALLQSREEEILAARERGNFLTALMNHELQENEAVARARSMGFDGSMQHLLPLAVTRRGGLRPPGRDYEDGAWALVWRDFVRELNALSIPVVAGTRPAEPDMLVVIGLDDPERRERILTRAAGVLQTAAKRNFPNIDAAVICAGPVSPSWLETRDGLAEAAGALQAALEGPPRPWHDVTRADLHRLLWALREEPSLTNFVDRRLALLIEHDRGRKSKLLPTLEAYCDHGGRKAETARALFLERQSLYNRLERIETLIGEDLGNEDTIFELQLALRARSYIERARTSD
jgi:PucR family transcriptional regulator, purine catabolism regulatory protein